MKHDDQNADAQTGNWTIATRSEFDFDGEEYKTLFASSKASAFQSPAWLSIFYSDLVPKLSLTAVIVEVRDENGKLVFLLPCVRQSVSIVKIIQPCDMGLADYNCPVIDPEAIPIISGDKELQQRILNALKPFDVFFFRKQRAGSVHIEDILSGAAVSPSEANAHEIPLYGPYDQWAKESLSSKSRSSNRSKMRKIVDRHGACDFEILSDDKDIEEALRFIQTHRGNRFHNDVLKQEPVFQFYLQLALRHAKDGFSQTFIMRVGEKTVTAFFGLNHNARHCYLLGSFEPGELEKYSIGIQTMNALIKQTVEDGFDTFDFSLGDEGYKSRFHAKKIELHHAIYVASPLGRIIALIYQHMKPMKSFIVGLAGRVR